MKGVMAADHLDDAVQDRLSAAMMEGVMLLLDDWYHNTPPEDGAEKEMRAWFFERRERDRGFEAHALVQWQHDELSWRRMRKLLEHHLRAALEGGYEPRAHAEGLPTDASPRGRQEAPRSRHRFLKDHAAILPRVGSRGVKATHAAYTSPEFVGQRPDLSRRARRKAATIDLRRLHPDIRAHQVTALRLVEPAIARNLARFAREAREILTRLVPPADRRTPRQTRVLELFWHPGPLLAGLHSSLSAIVSYQWLRSRKSRAAQLRVLEAPVSWTFSAESIQEALQALEATFGAGRDTGVIAENAFDALHDLGEYWLALHCIAYACLGGKLEGNELATSCFNAGNLNRRFWLWSGRTRRGFEADAHFWFAAGYHAALSDAEPDAVALALNAAGAAGTCPEEELAAKWLGRATAPASMSREQQEMFERLCASRRMDLEGIVIDDWVLRTE